jgi:hypothetical protein
VSLEPTKRLTTDVLLAWLAHPGTAIYAGYADRRENLELAGLAWRHTAVLDLATGRQLFVKVSYLLRF